MACALVVTATTGLDPSALHANEQSASSNRLVRMPIMRKPQEMDILETARMRQKQRNTLTSLQKRKQASTYQASLYNDQGSQYLISIGVGTPPQNFSVTLDTGSADLWIPSSTCDKTSCPFGGFNTAASSTFQEMQEKFSIQYGIGSVNGTYVQDTVNVAGAKVSQQQFGLAEHTKDILIPQENSGGSSSSASLDANGILGLGYPQLTAATTQNNPAYTPFVFNLVQQGLIQEPIFSVYMNSASQLGWSGEIIFGGVDKSKYEGDLIYLPVAKLQSHPSPSPEGTGNSGGPGSEPGSDPGSQPGGDSGDGDGGGVYDDKEEDYDGDDDESGDDDATGSFVEKHHLRTIDLTNLDISIDEHIDLRRPLHKSDSNSTGSPNYDGYYYWMVYGQGIAVRNGAQSPQFKLQKTGAFILDTGTTLTYLPNDVAVSIATAMAGSNGFQLDRQSGLLVVDCSAATSSATLELQMSTSPSLTSPPVTFAVKASELVIPLDGKTAATAKTCLFGIAPVGGSGGGLGSNMFLIGDSMLRSSYLVFDMGKNMVGIAAAKGMGASVNGTGASSSSEDGNVSESSASLRHGLSLASLCNVLCYLATHAMNGGSNGDDDMILVILELLDQIMQSYSSLTFHCRHAPSTTASGNGQLRYGHGVTHSGLAKSKLTNQNAVLNVRLFAEWCQHFSKFRQTQEVEKFELLKTHRI